VRGLSLARQLLLVQLAGILTLVVVGALLAWLDASRAVYTHARDDAVAVARTAAAAPEVAEAAGTPDPSVRLQPFAEKVRTDTGVDFVTIMSPAGIRYTHPNPSLIGKPFLGNTAGALAGRVLTETYTGTLGPSVRAVVPVFGPDHRVVALVAAGIKVTVLSGELAERLVPVVVAALAVLLVGGLGSWWVSARLRRYTRGMTPYQLGRVFASYEATLHAVREGLVLVAEDDSGGTVTLCNDGARDLLGLTGNPAGRPVGALGLPEGLVAALRSTEARTDEIHLTDTRVLVLSAAPVRTGQDRANVVTLRDHTDLQRLTGELTTTRGLAESLHAQAHEAANRLHTVVSLVEMGRAREAVEFATAELDLAQRLTDQVVSSVGEPVLAALLLGKSAEAAERGVELVLSADSALDGSESLLDPQDLVTILGNLVDNAVDAAVLGVGERPSVRAAVTVSVRRSGSGPAGGSGELLLRVSDTGPGIAEEARDAVFRRGWSSKPARGPGGRGLGLALVGQAVRRHGGTIELSDAEPGGAVFTVRLPMRPAVAR
jgi:two-component system, CitB family, sensor kinase